MDELLKDYRQTIEWVRVERNPNGGLVTVPQNVLVRG